MKILNNEVHLWIYNVDLNCINYDLQKEYYENLPLITQKRIDRYKFESLRTHSILRNIFLRKVLSKYHNNHYSEWSFKTTNNGKPEIDQPLTELRFNISSTSDQIICGVTRKNVIGVDIEKMEQAEDLQQLARRYFSPYEINYLQAEPMENFTLKFYEIWVLKESFIKATGLGLSTPLNSFNFHVAHSSIPQPSIEENITISFNTESSKYKNDHWKSWLLSTPNNNKVAITVREKIKTDQTIKIYSIDEYFNQYSQMML